MSSQALADERAQASGATAGRIGFGVFLLSTVVLSFVAGAFVILSGSFPAGYLGDAYRGGKALIDKQTNYPDRFRTDLWMPARDDRRGVTVHDPARAQDGLTLYTSGDGTHARLVTMTGALAHEWRLPYSAVWNENAAVQNPQPDDFMYWRKAHLFANGDLLAIYVAAGDSPWGYGLVKLNARSEPIWTYLQQVHHDVDVGADGRIYTLTHAFSRKVHDGFPHLTTPRIDDSVVVLSPDGEELRRVPILDAFVNSPYARLLNKGSWYNDDDFIHTNSIDVIDEGAAAALPFAEAGQVLLSFRDIDTIAVLDLERQQIVWALRGPWMSQHDADVLPNGEIMLFDNLGHFGPGGRSRIIAFDPTTSAITWQYTGTPETQFDSEVRAAQQRLANGNTLITEAVGGRLFEVTPAGEIVWEYVNPVRANDPDDAVRQLIPVTSWAQRIDPARLDPDFARAIAPD